jgi:O-antigen ligase
MALTMPFLLHFAVQRYNLVVRIFAVASMPILLFTALITQSRLGVIGVGLSFLTYLLLWALLRRNRSKTDLIAPAIILAYPAIFATSLIASFAVRRIRYAVWGGGEAAESTEGREVQYAMGIPKVLHQPWGYGIGQSGDILDYREAAGNTTIDTYYLSAALDYGIVGFILFFSFFLVAIYKGALALIHHAIRDRELMMIMPVTVALINFVVVKSVFSQQDNHPLVFIMVGLLGALLQRCRTTVDEATASAGAPQ